MRAVVFQPDGKQTVVFDDAYTTGTATCNLETKFRWKLGDPATRGDAPFKAPRPVGMWDERAAAMLTSVAELTGSKHNGTAYNFETICIVLDAALKAAKDEKCGTIKGTPSCADMASVLTPTEQEGINVNGFSAFQALATETEVSDKQMCDDVTAMIEAEKAKDKPAAPKVSC